MNRSGGGNFSNNKINLILNFDVNKTLIAIDPVSNKDVDEVLKGALSGMIQAQWKENGIVNPLITTPISYEEYIKDIRQIGKEERRKYVVDFFDYLANEHPDLYIDAMAKYEAAIKVYTEMKAEGKELFESFYKLIEYLDKCNNISYQIVVRTYGKDIPEIVEELEEHLGWDMDIAKFYQGGLLVHDKNGFVTGTEFVEKSGSMSGVSEIIKDKRSIFDWIKNNKNHLAIRDDYMYWHKHGSMQAYGKPLLLEPYNSNDQIPTLSIFFDDNVETPPSDTNIVAPFDVINNEDIPMDVAMSKGYVYQADTLRALADPNYYIDLVNKSIVSNVFDKKSECQQIGGSEYKKLLNMLRRIQKSGGGWGKKKKAAEFAFPSRKRGINSTLGGIWEDSKEGVYRLKNYENRGNLWGGALDAERKAAEIIMANPSASHMSRIFSCIIPHAGKQYAGDARSDVFNYLNNANNANNRINEIIYIAALHNPINSKGVYVLKDDIGIFKNNNWVTKSGFPDGVLKEHSYEWVKNELPASKHTVIIPTGNYNEHFYELSEIIKKYLENNINALLVGTTDLIHYGKSYNLTGWDNHEQYSKIKYEGPLIKALQSCENTEISKLFNANNFLGCGRYSIELVSDISKKLGCIGTVVSYYDSDQSQYKNDDIKRYSFNTKPVEKFVSYVGMIFSKEKKLTDIDVKLSLGAIRSVINTTIKNEEIRECIGYIPIWTEWYLINNGVFVGTSMYKNSHKKTNCSYGRYQSLKSTAVNIVDAAGDCYNDSKQRWKIPLELNGNVNYKLEILQNNKEWEKIKASDIKNYSKDMNYGYYLNFNNFSATYLPGVWEESLADKTAEEMLSSLAGKASGMQSNDAWKQDKNAYVKLYSSCKIYYDSKNKFKIHKCANAQMRKYYLMKTKT